VFLPELAQLDASKMTDASGVPSAKISVTIRNPLAIDLWKEFNRREKRVPAPKQEKPVRLCQNCGLKPARQKFCSDLCRQQAHRKKLAESPAYQKELHAVDGGRLEVENIIATRYMRMSNGMMFDGIKDSVGRTDTMLALPSTEKAKIVYPTPRRLEFAVEFAAEDIDAAIEKIRAA
jgi:hypothetical protein